MSAKEKGILPTPKQQTKGGYPMTQRATIENYAQAVRIAKKMNIDYHQWKENLLMDTRP